MVYIMICPRFATFLLNRACLVGCMYTLGYPGTKPGYIGHILDPKLVILVIAGFQTWLYWSHLGVYSVTSRVYIYPTKHTLATLAGGGVRGGVCHFCCFTQKGIRPKRDYCRVGKLEQLFDIKTYFCGPNPCAGTTTTS